MNKKHKVLLGVVTTFVAVGIIFGITANMSPKKIIEVYVDNIKMETFATINDKSEVVVDADWFASVSESTFDTETQTVLQTNTELEISTDKNQIGLDGISSLGWRIEFKDGTPATLNLYTPVKEVVSEVTEAPIEPELFPITLESITGTINKDETIQLVAAYDGASVLVYESSNPEVATVTEAGLVSWVSEGTSTIMVSALDGYPATYEVICNKVIVPVVPVTKDQSTTSPTTVPHPEVVPPTIENPKEAPSVSGKNETIEIENESDQRKWEPGVGVSFNTFYSDGMSRKEVFADIQEIVSPYGLTVMESGTIGSGYSDSDGYIRLNDGDGPWKFYIYEWRDSPTDTQGAKAMNSALQVFKYFLGSENGANLWGFIDAHLTKQKPKVSDYGITDVGDEINIGTFVFADGTEVAYDQTRMSQFLMFTF